MMKIQQIQPKILVPSRYHLFKNRSQFDVMRSQLFIRT